MLNSVASYVLLMALALLLPVSADELEPAAAENGVLEVFVRDGCPHCEAAKTWLTAIASERPEVRIVYRTVDRDAQAREDLARHVRAAGIWPPGVPTFVFNGEVLVGFESAERTGPDLLALIDRRTTVPDSIETGLFGTLSVSTLGLPVFTLAIGLLDGLNPCAMWVLLFLLSMLVHQKSRMRMAVIAGIFVLVSGTVYYAFMAAWLNIFLMIGLSTAVRLGLAGLALTIGVFNVKDFLAPGLGFSFSIPDSAKPGLYARMRAVARADNLKLSLAAVTVLAVVVNFVELLCTAGFPALYTAILTQQGLNPAAHYGYLGLYILGYMADDSLMVGMAVLALSSRKLAEDAGRWLKLLSGVAMLALGAIMMLRPEWLF
jgi:glutaredoxin